jgi:microcystin-dependent protein
MSNIFLGQITTTAFDYAPRGWALCDGRLLQINQNQALFSLLGTQFGGNGVTTFALPDLRGRVPMHTEQLNNVGQAVGAPAVTLQAANLPAHGHALNTTTELASTFVPGGAVPAARPRAGPVVYAAAGSTPSVSLRAESVGLAGGTQPHDNMQPSLGLNFIIALQGIFPSRD